MEKAMKINHRFFTPPHLIFTLLLALTVFTGCQVESDDEKATYTVTYNANGGEGEMKAQSAKEGTEITLTANAFTREGFTFSGWNTAADGKGADYADKSTIKLTENLTLYAKWVLQGSWSINYVLNGDDVNPAQNAETNPAEYNIETATVTLADPTRSLYEFAGWYGNADFSGEKLTGWNEGEKTGDITLYAKWTITADSVSEAIKNIPADGNVHTVVLAGEISEDIITAIRKALIAKPEIKVNLDLSGTTGLTEIPAWAFFDEDEWTACEALAGIVLPEGMESINEYAFFFCPNLTDIVIPDSVKTIGKQAFNQSGLTSIKFGSGLESIGRFAFQACNLTKITVPGNVKTIIHGAFDACVNLEEAVLEEGVQTIGEVAFASCEKLSAVTIPKSVTSIGDSAFSFGSGNSLQTVNYGGTMAEWNALKASIGTSNDVLLNAAIYCTDGSLNTDAVSVINRLGEGEHTVTVTGEVSAEYLAEIAEAIKEKDYRDTKIILDMSGATGLDAIPEMTFNANLGLAGIVLPQSVTSIENGAFATCIELKSVKIGSGVTKIDDLAFVNCTSLTSIEIPDSVTSVGAQSFQACESLKDVTLGKGLASISSCMFQVCSALEMIVIPAEVESIEDYAFGDCTSLADVCYGGTVAEWNALKNDGKIDSTGNDALLNATIHCTDGIAITADKAAELITSLESGEYNIAVTGAITSETISTIATALQSNGNAKVGLDLSKTTGLTSIGEYAFMYCSSLTSVIIPDSVTSIGTGAFIECTSLTSLSIPDSVESIENSTFSGCTSLTSVNISNSVTSIGAEAFCDCSSLTSVNIPASVSSIGNKIFYKCTSLTELTVSEDNETYESDGKCIYTKDGKTLIAVAAGLTSVTIPDGITSIGGYAFCGCINLTSVNIPNTVTSIADSAFSMCTNLTSINIPDSVTSIGECAFMESGLTSITIPSGVTSISSYMFKWCGNLKSVVIPASVISIGENVFTASGLTTVNYRGTQAQWNAITIADNSNPLKNATVNYNYTGE